MNKSDKQIQKKFRDRLIQPSESAWERMSLQLDEIDRKSRFKTLRAIGYAASVLLLIATYFIITNQSQEPNAVPKDVYVNEPIDTTGIKSKFEEIIKESNEVLVVNTDKKVHSTSKDIFQSRLKDEVKLIRDVAVTRNKIAIDLVDTSAITSEKNEIINKDVQQEIDRFIKPKFNTKNAILVDSDALLYAVTHNNEDVQSYYKKYKIARVDALKEVEKQLRKSNMNTNAETILAQVEMDLMEESFENNFFKNLKKRVSEVITYISTRNE